MERRIKVLGCLLIIVVVITTLGCASSGLRSEGKKGANELSFVDWSHGLPATGQWRQGLSFYDMNGDGHVDIAAPPPRQAKKGHDTPVVWHGNGKGEWSEVRPDVPSDIIYNYGGIAVADFDGDGIPDIGLAMHGKGVKVFKGKGKDKYVDFSAGLPSEKEFASRAIVSADFNNDGIADIAAVSEAKFGENFPIPSGVRICSHSDNRWKCNPVGDEKEVLGLYADQLTAGDVNGDGNKDIAVASLVHVRDLIVWIGDGKGSFAPFNKGLPQEKHYVSVALCDINKDGRDDLVACVSGIGGEAFLGLKAFLSGPDTFKEISEGLPTNEGFTSVSACDLNGDGRVEIVAATGEGGIKIFSQKGDRWREASVSGLPEEGLSRIYNLYCIDLNGDGYKDIAVNYALGQNNSGGIRVFLNVPQQEGDQTRYGELS